MNCKLKEVVLHVPVEVIRDLINLNHDILHVIQPFFIIYTYIQTKLVVATRLLHTYSLINFKEFLCVSIGYSNRPLKYLCHTMACSVNQTINCKLEIIQSGKHMGQN